MTDKSFSSLSRMLSVLDLFNEQHSTWTAEAITEALEVSLPTGYRYVKMLVDAGLLQRAADSRYTLGPRIIMLDHFIRKTDPVLQHGLPILKELVDKTGFDCVVSELYGQQVLDTHREYGNLPASLSYGRGRPRPLFRGGAPKIILAQLPAAQLRKLFEAHRDEVAGAGLPAEFEAFRKVFAQIRKQGHYVSQGELESNLSAVAAPLFKPDGSVQGAVSLVTTVSRMAVMDLPKLAQLVMRAAQEISARMT
jgi:DNA-binding IclR family transcriptional regulator